MEPSVSEVGASPTLSRNCKWETISQIA